MYNFTDEETPSHRPDAPDYAHYSQYRKILREDFFYRCAYCNDLDKHRIRSFAIDHFVPRTPVDFVSTILSNQYDNLIYCCSYCNRAKWNKWPTKDEKIQNDGKIGFLKPTDENYKTFFFRNVNGRIIPTEGNELANHIRKELLLWHPIHSLMWKIERLSVLRKKVKLVLEKTNNDELNAIYSQLSIEYADVMDNIFSFNE